MTNHTFRMPETSVITSWRVRTRHDEPIRQLPFSEDQTPSEIIDLLAGDPKNYAIPGIDRALAEEVGMIDLYWLDHHEIPIYAAAAGLFADWNHYAKSDPENNPFSSPLKFLNTLNKENIENIGKFLLKRIIHVSSAKGIGLRPRISGIATYFPYISLPNFEEADSTGKSWRQYSVQAIRATLCLAEYLGIPCIEIVCGSKIPIPKTVRGDLSPKMYHQERENALIQSLEEIYSQASTSDNFQITNDSPKLALELEPGPSYLLNSLEAFSQIIDSPTVEKIENKSLKIGLNIDIAHFFLIGVKKPEKTPEDTFTKKYGGRIFHAHISDHAGDHKIGGVHASDLIPGSFHSMDEYMPWIELITDASKTPHFSGIVSIELESSFVVEELLAARSIVQRWVQDCAQRRTQNSTPQIMWAINRFHKGTILVIDLGNSTYEFFARQSTPGNGQEEGWDEGSERLGRLGDDLCRNVRSYGGSALSFTGDGLVAFFDETILPSRAADQAIQCSQSLAEILKKQPETLTLRCSLHWGSCYIPPDGPLEENAIGRDVVVAARLCAWLGDTIERAAARAPDSDNRSNRPAEAVFIGCTSEYKKQLELEGVEISKWSRWGKVLLKGLPDDKEIFLLPSINI